MRKGATDDIYVIPAPHWVTFGTATLLAAACCIPAILSLISMWEKILEINWKSRFGQGEEDELIEGTNGATVKSMRGVNTLVGRSLRAVEIPVLGAAVLAILIVGEVNLFSSQLRYETEPMESIGTFAVLVTPGSLH